MKMHKGKNQTGENSSCQKDNMINFGFIATQDHHQGFLAGILIANPVAHIV